MVETQALTNTETTNQRHQTLLTPIDPNDALGMLGSAPDVSPALRAIIGRMARLFALRSPDAPGLALAGGVLALSETEQMAAGMPAMSVTGNGLDLTAALTACFGEAADALSQFERPGDLVSSRRAPQLLTGWLADAAGTAGNLDWVLGADAHDGGEVLVPADICLRRVPQHQAFAPAGALSSGCAAGPTVLHAKTRAVLELIERDAAALWWLGCRQGKALAPSPMLDELMRHLRGTATGRHNILLDITTDIGVPVVAACSHDGHGQFFACGVASRATQVDAARAAILEMAQMELSAPIARIKAAEQGETALNASDRRHIARAMMDCATLPMLAPAAGEARTAVLADAAERLGELGQHLVYVDLTRPDIGVPVFRAIAPGLQPFSEAVVTARLAAITAKTGGGARHHHGIMPF
jgi:thiazole/oxazole-forming peptide maturase SagD family component